MFFVAACPGGNLSNYFSLVGKANAALSVSLTAISPLTSIVCTPFLFQFWGNRYGPTAELLRRIDISLMDSGSPLVPVQEGHHLLPHPHPHG
jgi:BASS family bile acid:Na+ symporter